MERVLLRQSYDKTLALKSILQQCAEWKMMPISRLLWRRRRELQKIPTALLRGDITHTSFTYACAQWLLLFYIAFMHKHKWWKGLSTSWMLVTSNIKVERRQSLRCWDATTENEMYVLDAFCRFWTNKYQFNLVIISKQCPYRIMNALHRDRKVYGR